MEEESSRGAVRLMNFVSEEKLEEAKRSRGERVEDGTAQRDRPLFEILKENKDKRDAEFNERFKHRPPKALDQDESEFLDNLEQSRREYEQQVADEEAQQLRTFQAAQSTLIQELNDNDNDNDKEVAKPQEKEKEKKKKNRPQPPPHLPIITVKKPKHKHDTTSLALVSYSDDSEDDDT